MNHFCYPFACRTRSELVPPSLVNACYNICLKKIFAGVHDDVCSSIPQRCPGCNVRRSFINAHERECNDAISRPEIICDWRTKCNDVQTSTTLNIYLMILTTPVSTKTRMREEKRRKDVQMREMSLPPFSSRGEFTSRVLETATDDEFRSRDEKIWLGSRTRGEPHEPRRCLPPLEGNGTSEEEQTDEIPKHRVESRSGVFMRSRLYIVVQPGLGYERSGRDSPPTSCALISTGAQRN